MRAIIEDENADDGVKLRSYCQKHSVNSKKEKSSGSGSEEEEVKRKRRKDMTSEEKTQARAARLQEIEKEFDKHVSVKDISSHLLDVDQDAINYIYNYWKLKRRSGHNRPLLPPKSDDNELLTHRQEQADLDKMKMFVQLRQDLERVRNLCYMVSRREKLSRSFFRMREQTFHKQVAVLSSGSNIPEQEMTAIVEANHGPSIYDRLYSHPNAADHKSDFDDLLARIAPSESGDEKKKDRNGLVRRSRSSNPYRKHYVNGSRRSGSMYGSGLSSEESEAEIARTSKYKARAIGSSTEDDGDTKKKPSTSPKKKVSPKTKAKRSPKKNERKKKKKVPQSKALVESSSEEDAVNTRAKKDRAGSKTLRQMEKEMAAGKHGESASESDELLPIRSTRSSKFPVDIYSDSSEDSANQKAEIKSEGETKPDKEKIDRLKSEKSPSGNDSQQSLPRTKAAMKEFVPSHAEKKEPHSTDEKPAPKKRGRKPSNKEKKPIKTQESDDEARNKENKFAKQKDNPTDLIVPQRQAAKKASENMRSTTIAKKEEPSTEKVVEEPKPKLKGKGKGKEIKSPPAKVTRQTSKEAEKETIAYVPQRQAAKKAAAHIKNIGSKIPVVETASDNTKKKDEKPEITQVTEEVKKKVVQKESSSSSSGSSSSSYSSSSSSEEETEKHTPTPGPKPTAKAREIKPAPRLSTTVFSPPGSRPTVDLPFLDKVSRPLSSTSASSDSESSRSDRSGSSTPTPKRPRRRRKGKSSSNDVSPRKAPDKKLKTSERESECRVPSPTAEREESGGASDARAATRARTRSTTSSGNMSNKPDAGSRKPSKDDATYTPGSNKTPKASRQSGELPTSERKTNEETVKDTKKLCLLEDDIKLETPKNDVKPKSSKTKRPSTMIEEKDIPRYDDMTSPSLSKPSPRKSAETKQKTIVNRRASVKDIKPSYSADVEPPRDTIKQRRQSRYEAQETSSRRTSTSPTKKPLVVDNPDVEIVDKKTPIHINDNYNDSDKHWLPKAPSPTIIPPQIEKPGGNDKYMTDDKSFDSDSTEKTSVKMMAKIQANLNENTMIKSPRTPMDARSITMENIDVDSHLIMTLRKRSTLENISQDASNVQGVEISKSAKIPSALNPYPNRSIFSPQQKDNEIFAFDMMAVDDGFNHDDIMKPFSSYPEFFFKEDSKEQGVQETMNLVDRLRMQLSSKKVTNDGGSQDQSVVSNDENDPRDDENVSIQEKGKEDTNRETSPKKGVAIDVDEMRTPKQIHNTVNHVPRAVPVDDVSVRKSTMEEKSYQPIPMTSNDKWSHVPIVHNEQKVDQTNRKYEPPVPYSEEVKEPPAIQSDAQSASGDTTSLSKQSEDSQPSVVDNSVHSNDVDLTQDNQNYDNNNSVIHSDCATISSPYMSQESKWRESKITTRRSSASSTNSEGSMISQDRERSVMKSHMNACDTHTVTVIPEIDSYPPIPAYSCPVEPSMPLNQYSTYPPNASPFLTMGSLFGPQLPLPSPGPLYPPMSYSSASLIPPKPTFPLCAAFTSSSQNIALTTAMIAPPTPKPIDSPRDDIDVTGSDKFSIHVASSPSISVDSYEASRATKISNDSSETITSMTTQENKSSPLQKDSSLPLQSKPVTKFPGKSPGKSPGISPKQNEVAKGNKRPSNKSNRSQRGRGRSKSRGGQNIHPFPPVDYMGNSIRSKLVGTVYDFEEEIANDSVDLKALRERRKSIDIRDDRKSEHSYKDASQSPQIQSPQQNNKKTPSVDIKEIAKPPTPEPEERVSSPVEMISDRGVGFSQVAPVLPGPVDMRTYQPMETPAPPVHAHLLPCEMPGVPLDDDHDKHLPTEHNPVPPSSPAPPPELLPPKEPYTPHLPKVSLSDSRNQLKVKIKGPFLDANYSTSSVTPVVPPPPAPIHETPINIMNTSSMSASSMMSGSTNLRRMRKKELLRQYWTQDMNMDDSGNPAIMGAVPPPAAPAPLSRAVITIPKAVASMTSIPTREDYKIIDTPIEKKKRKVSSGLSRELRHLKVTMNDDVDPAEDSAAKMSSYGANSSQAHKRRGRVSTKPNRAPATSPVAPKLKIKIGSNVVQQVNEEPSDFRPPKKRLIPKPSLEDLRRESMKYRRMVMAKFEENEKPAKHKQSKSEKRKKKKDKKADKLQVINSESESAPKLIIKIKRPVPCGDEESNASGSSGAEASTGVSRAGGAEAAAAAVPEPTLDPFEYDPTAPDPLAIDAPSYSEATSATRKVRTAKVTPIRLKLARTQGSSYVMKGEEDAAGPSDAVAAPKLPPPASQPPHDLS